MDDDADGPHQGQPIARQGVSLDRADVAVVLCHGRGATAQGMIALAHEFDHEGVAYLAPQAARQTWYPHSFLEPVAKNEPWLSSALELVGDIVGEAEDAGIAPEKIVLGGFSQGACLASEFAARDGRPYGAVVAFSGGLIGPQGTAFDYDGEMTGTQVFLGCSDADPHIPVERVHETRDVFESMGADVDERIYEGMGHTVNDDELQALDDLLGDLLADSEGSR